jgi:hypothetical protein
MKSTATAKVGRSQWDIVHMMRFCIEVLEGKRPETNDRKITKSIALIPPRALCRRHSSALHVGAQYFDALGKPRIQTKCPMRFLTKAVIRSSSSSLMPLLAGTVQNSMASGI